MDTVDLRCGMCGYRLSRTQSHFHSNVTLLLCTNCGCAFSRTISQEGKATYKFLGVTSGNNEIREILNMEDIK